MKLWRGKKWWHGEKKHIDEQKREARLKAERELKRLLDSNDLEGYLNYVAQALLQRKLTAGEREHYTKLFYDARGEHPGGA
jgi:hypothetical protein